MNVVAPRAPLSERSGFPDLVWGRFFDLLGIIATSVTQSGTTGARPGTGLYIGRVYFDTTLGIPVWWDGANWVNATGATV